MKAAQARFACPSQRPNRPRVETRQDQAAGTHGRLPDHRTARSCGESPRLEPTTCTDTGSDFQPSAPRPGRRAAEGHQGNRTLIADQEVLLPWRRDSQFRPPHTGGEHPMRRAAVAKLSVCRALARLHVPAVLALRVAVGPGRLVRSRYLLTGRAVALVVIDVRVRRVDRVVVSDLRHESSLPGTPGW